jgi:cytochrome c-type biogenesis protein CcmH/NrfG
MARMPFTSSPSGNPSEDHNRDSNKPERDRARRRPEKMNACEARWLQSLLESFEEEEEKEDLGPLSFKVLIVALLLSFLLALVLLMLFKMETGVRYY